MKYFKNVLCALMSLIMLVCSFAFAPVSAATLSDGEITVDFTDSSAVFSSISGVKCDAVKDGVKFSQKAADDIHYYGVKLPDCDIIGNIYEISYWTEASDLSDRVMLQVLCGGNGYTGWNSVAGNTNQMMIFDNSGNNTSSKVTFARDNDAANNNRQYFKVVVDGESLKMKLYTLSGGEYKYVTETAINTSGATYENYLQLRLLNWDSLTDGNHVAVGGVKVKRQLTADEKISVKGYQRTQEENGKYSLRFTAGLASTEYTDYGMIIKCKLNGVKAWRFDVKGKELLSEISQEKNGVKSTVSAQELDAAALYTAVIDNVPADAKSLSVEIIPYCTENGVRIEGVAKKFLVENGKIVTQTEYQLAKHKDKIKIYGRSANISTGIACDFSASGIEFKAKVSGDVILKVNSTSTSYYTLYINGTRQDKRLEFKDGTAEYVIAENLAEKEYTFKLIKQTQITHSTSTIMSLNINGKLLERPENKKLLIEFAGDSITCGYALIGYPTEGVTNYRGAEHMDASQSYAYLTAQNLGADHSFVSASGWAVLPSENNTGCIPDIYGKTSYRRGDAAYTPTRTADIVVIHLGTNDLFSRTNYETDFVAAAGEFIKDVKAMNPNAKIVWAYGSMMGTSNCAKFKVKVDSIVSNAGGTAKGVYSVQLPTDTSGGHNHPSVNGHVESARILADFITNTVLK